MAIKTKAASEEASIPQDPDSIRLARFVALLALDWYRLQAFLAEPGEEMAAANLTEREKSLLRTGCFKNLCDYLWEAGQAPVPGGDAPPDK